MPARPADPSHPGVPLDRGRFREQWPAQVLAALYHSGPTDGSVELRLSALAQDPPTIGVQLRGAGGSSVVAAFDAGQLLQTLAALFCDANHPRPPGGY